MGSLMANKQFNLKDEKTNLILTFLQNHLDKNQTFLCAKDEYFAINGSLKYWVTKSELNVVSNVRSRLLI